MTTSATPETLPVEPDDHRSPLEVGSIQVRRPPFFKAGQLLTAEDLNELAQYSRYHLALRASRRSRGVVAGLHVHAAAQDRSCLVIGPGYAIADQGEELVLDRTLTVPLRILIGKPVPEVEDSVPAAGPDDLTRISGINTTLNEKLTRLGFDRFEQIAHLTEDDKERINAVLDFKDRFEREQWVDQAKRLLAQRRRPKSVAYDLYARPARSAHKSGSDEPAGHILDRYYNLVMLPAADEGPEVPWLASFADRLGPIKTLVQHMAEPAVGFVEAFKALVAECPPRYFPVLTDEVARLPAYPPPSPYERSRLAWLFAIDLIRGYLANEPTADDTNGLRLARVWVVPKDKERGEVQMVDETARQAASGRYHDLPAPPSKLNIASVLGVDCQRARAQLERAGVNVRRLNAVALGGEPSLDALTRLTTAPPLAEIGAFYDIDYINLDGLGARAIGLRPLAALDDDGLIVELSCTPPHAMPGDQAIFSLLLENVGQEIINIQARSSSIAVDIANEQLLPRARLVVNATMTVPERFGTELPDNWTALGDGSFRFDAAVDIRSTGGRADRKVMAEVTAYDRSAIQPLLLLVEQKTMPHSIFSDCPLILDFELTNKSEVALDVDLMDADGTRLEPTPLRLEPGKTRSWPPASRPPLTAAESFVLKAIGRADDGRLVVTTTNVSAQLDPFWQHLRRYRWAYLMLAAAFLIAIIVGMQ